VATVIAGSRGSRSEALEAFDIVALQYTPLGA
jgi:hypothetical protein